MASTDSSSSNAVTKLIGYLSFVTLPGAGVVGGLLLVNQRARPVEFHCTTPMPTSRVNEILYGATHREALLADQLGTALINQAVTSAKGTKRSIELMVTDDVDALELRSQVAIPITLLASDDETEGNDLVPPTNSVKGREDNDRRDNDGEALRTEWSFEIGGYCFTNTADYPEDRETIRARLATLGSAWDLAEPFERIRDAINEAHRAAA